ncbi:hypothetical protein AOLI_G00297250 [Acnodon oligacanthus]
MDFICTSAGMGKKDGLHRYSQFLFSWLKGSYGVQANFLWVPAAPRCSLCSPPAPRASGGHRAGRARFSVATRAVDSWE